MINTAALIFLAMTACEAYVESLIVYGDAAIAGDPHATQIIQLDQWACQVTSKDELDFALEIKHCVYYPNDFIICEFEEVKDE